MAHLPEKIILSNMCMIIKDDEVLVQDRIKSWCGVAFPGGHVEKHESIVDSTIREIKEETGLTISNLKLCGIKQWFKDDVRNICFLFKTSTFEGELTSNDEGKNFFVKRSELKNYKLASNFEIMLQVFDNDGINEHFHERMFDDSEDILK